MIQSDFKCPNCEIGMEYRTTEREQLTPAGEPREKTHAWFCPECPIICFEFLNEMDLKALAKLIK